MTVRASLPRRVLSHVEQHNTSTPKGPSLMNGYNAPHFARELINDRQQRMLRDAGRSRLYREAKRLRAYRRTP